jgi:pyrroline-5-carboxylate reductase
MTFVLVGGGVMGEAMLAAALNQGVIDRETTIVCEKLPERREALESAYGVTTTDNMEAAVTQGDTVVVAVKPQDASALQGRMKPDALLVSVMAGVKIAAVQELLDHRLVIRAMPNTPAAIQRGMSAWFAADGVSPAHRDFARKLLGAFGRELEVDSELKLDMVTAVSGSGPAYVFLFIEALIDAAVSIGLTRAQAELLVMQTVSGSAEYAVQSGVHPAQLRGAVTSPAGTTAAGIARLERNGLRAAIEECVQAAFHRSLELGGNR